MVNEDIFKDTFNDLFDVEHPDALTTITIPEDKAFLLAQREKGRRGMMSGVDVYLAKKEKEKARKNENYQARMQKQKDEIGILDRNVFMESSSSSTDRDDELDSEVNDSISEVTPSTSKRKRQCGRSNIILTLAVLSSLDRSKISARRAMQIITPILHTCHWVKH